MQKIECLIYELSEPRKLYLKKEIINLSDIKQTEIVAKTIYSAISPGTEVAAYTGMEKLRDDREMYPRVNGYCNVAQIIYIGSSVTKLKTGDYILSFQSHRSHFIFTENDFYVTLKNKNIKTASVAYLYHLGYHSMLTANLQAGHNVGIIGLGVLGYTASMMCKIAGANTFTFTNQSAQQALLHEKNIICYPKNLDCLQNILQKTNNVGLDVIINTSNTWDDWLLSLQLVNKGGTIVNLGFPGRGQEHPQFNPLDPKFLYMKNIAIKYLSALNEKGAAIFEQRFNEERNLEYILQLIENNTIDATEIISTEIMFTELEQQYQLYESRKENLFTTILKW